MPGVSYVQTQYSASIWYINVDASLMGIQSTAQFVDKYHHIIGKEFTVIKFTFNRKEHEGTGLAFKVGRTYLESRIARKTQFSLIRDVRKSCYALSRIFMRDNYWETFYAQMWKRYNRSSWRMQKRRICFLIFHYLRIRWCTYITSSSQYFVRRHISNDIDFFASARRDSKLLNLSYCLNDLRHVLKQNKKLYEDIKMRWNGSKITFQSIAIYFNVILTLSWAILLGCTYIT